MSQNEPSAGAMRASKAIFAAGFAKDVGYADIAQIIDRETGLKELTEALRKAEVFIGSLKKWQTSNPVEGDAHLILNELRSALKLAQGGPK